MSERRAAGNTHKQAFALSAIAAVVAAVAVALRLIGFGDALSDRALTLVMIAAAGGFGAMLTAAVMALWFAERWRRWPRALLGGLIAGGLFVPATMFFFAVKLRIIDGRVEAESASALTVAELFWSLFGAMGMFTPTGLRYLLPWPALAVGVMAAFILYAWPRRPTGVA